MEGENVTVAFPQSSNTMPPEITGQRRIDGEERRLCPLCQSDVRLFFINFNEKMMMCENTECEFPFGHEELEFVKDCNEVEYDEVLGTIRTSFVEDTTTLTSGEMSSAFRDIDKMNNYDNQLEMKTLINSDINERRKFLRQKEEEILRHIQDIKQLNVELSNMNASDGNSGVRIKNEKWIKNLKNIQEISGFQLLKPEEINLLKKEEPELGLGELKINIDPGNENNMSSIKIERHKQPNKDMEQNTNET